MKRCKYCKEEINEKASVCPYCRRRQKRKKGKVLEQVLKTVLVIAIFFLSLGLGISFLSDFLEKNKEKQSIVNTISESEFKSSCKSVSYDELARDKNMMKGSRLTVTGKVVQADRNMFRLSITKTNFGYDDAIVFEFDTNSISENILEDDIITIWGVSEGSYRYKAVLGNYITVPKINAYYVERS